MKLYQKIPLIFFGLSLTIVILEIGLRIAGFTILSIQEYRNLQSIKQKGEFRIMCLGESTTQNQYPSFLEEILNQRNIGIKFSVIDEGIAGTTTAAILGRLESNLDKYKPDIVVTMMGINDSGSYMLYEAASASKIALITHSCKVYKLARLIRLHVAAKLKEVSKKQESIQQEQLSNKAIELNPDSDSASMRLGWFYKDQGKFTESEEAFKKAIELNPNNDSAYIELARLYKNQWKFYETEQLFKKAIELNPNNTYTYMELGWLYRHYKKFAEGEQSFKKAIELNPNNDSAYIELGWLYEDQKKFAEGEQLLKKAIELDPNNEHFYGSLAMIYCDMGNNELSKMYAEKADNLRYEYYNSVTSNNYQALKLILDKRKIRLVSVQYPVRSLGSLKKIFQKESDDIILVDNEKIFKDVVKKEGYEEYFRDMFGGDFGHCTEKGNRLLAENIANTILKEYFNK